MGIGVSYIVRQSKRRKTERQLQLITQSSSFDSEGENSADIDPKPINMAQDKDAYERMILRSRRNEEVILHANKKLHEERSNYVIPDDGLSKAVSFKLNEVRLKASV